MKVNRSIRWLLFLFPLIATTLVWVMINLGCLNSSG